MNEDVALYETAADVLNVDLGDVAIVWTNPGTRYNDGSQDTSYGFTVGGKPWDEARPEERIVVVKYHDGNIRA